RRSSDLSLKDLAAASRRLTDSPATAATGIPSAALPPIVTRPEMDPIAFVFASGVWAFAANAVNTIAVVAIKAWQSRRVRLFMGLLLIRVRGSAVLWPLCLHCSVC